MTIRRFEYGNDGKGNLQLRQWDFSDSEQKLKHEIDPPWDKAEIKKNSRETFTTDEVVTLEAETAGTQYEPDTDAGPGFWQRIVDRIRGK